MDGSDSIKARLWTAAAGALAGLMDEKPEAKPIEPDPVVVIHWLEIPPQREDFDDRETLY